MVAAAHRRGKFGGEHVISSDGFFDLKDPEEFKNVYSPMAEPTLDPYGGKFVMKHALPPPMAAKMGMKESKGFGTTGQMAFMLEFPDFDKAMGWFTGPEYAAVLTKRDEVGPPPPLHVLRLRHCPNCPSTPPRLQQHAAAHMRQRLHVLSARVTNRTRPAPLLVKT